MVEAIPQEVGGALKVGAATVTIDDFETLKQGQWVAGTVLRAGLVLLEIPKGLKVEVISPDLMTMFDIEEGGNADLWKSLEGSTAEEKRVARAETMKKSRIY